jgi:hypothetical protein
MVVPAKSEIFSQSQREGATARYSASLYHLLLFEFIALWRYLAFYGINNVGPSAHWLYSLSGGLRMKRASGFWLIVLRGIASFTCL